MRSNVRILPLLFVFTFLALASAFPASSTQHTTSLSENDDLRLAPRVWDGFPVASSGSSNWCIYLNDNIALTPIQESASHLEPFFREVLYFVKHQIAIAAPENVQGFRYVEGFLKLAFKCIGGKVQTCSWEAIRFLVEWQLDRIARGQLSFCLGALKGPRDQMIQFTFGTPSVTSTLLRAASASELHS